jgi:hypothetical protein
LPVKHFCCGVNGCLILIESHRYPPKNSR